MELKLSYNMWLKRWSGSIHIAYSLNRQNSGCNKIQTDSNGLKSANAEWRRHLQFKLNKNTLSKLYVHVHSNYWYENWSNFSQLSRFYFEIFVKQNFLRIPPNSRCFEVLTTFTTSKKYIRAHNVQYLLELKWLSQATALIYS